MIHDLKIWPEYFEAVRIGLKNFEIRKNDRGFQIGETLRLREYNPNTEEFSGKSIERVITYIVEGPPFMAEGWAVLGMIAKDQLANQLLYLEPANATHKGQERIQEPGR